MTDFLPGIRHEQTVVTTGSIGGSDISITAFVGVTEKGPVGEPTKVASFKDYLEVFGTFGTSDMAFVVKDFFDNGGGEAYILRVGHYTDITDASTLAGVKATLAADILDDSAASTINFQALYTGAYANVYRVSTTRASLHESTLSSDALSGSTELVLSNKVGLSPASVLELVVDSDFEPTDLASAIMFANLVKAAYNAHVADVSVHGADDSANAASSPNATDQASLTTLLAELESAYGTHQATGALVHTEPDIDNNLTAPAPNGADSDADQLTDSLAFLVDLATTLTDHYSHVTGASVQIHPTNDTTNLIESKTFVKVTEVNTSIVSGSLVHTATIATALASPLYAGTVVSSQEFTLDIFEDGNNTALETHAGLSMESDSSNYVVTRLSDAVTGSSLVEAVVSTTAGLGLRLPVDTTKAELQGGVNPEAAGIVAADLIGDENATTGVRALDALDDAKIIVLVPDNVSKDFYSNTLAFAMEDWVESTKDKVVFLEPDPDLTGAQQQAFVENNGIDSGFVSYFTPRIEVLDIRDRSFNTKRFISPLGAVAGRHSAVDNAGGRSGPWRSAAGEAPYGNISTALRVEKKFSKPLMSEMNRVGLNVIRPIKDKGILIYGVRTQSTNKEYKYINSVRTVIFIQTSIENDAGWLVFANNNSDTWVQAEDYLNGFLNTVWSLGGLAGDSPQEAYQVLVGERGGVQTPAETQSGKMNIVVRLATQTPAEFLTFRYELNKNGFTLVQ